MRETFIRRAYERTLSGHLQHHAPDLFRFATRQLGHSDGFAGRGLGLDFVRTPGNLARLLNQGIPGDKVLCAGVVNGRGVWKADLELTLAVLGPIMPRSVSRQSG